MAMVGMTKVVMMISDFGYNFDDDDDDGGDVCGVGMMLKYYTL